MGVEIGPQHRAVVEHRILEHLEGHGRAAIVEGALSSTAAASPPPALSPPTAMRDGSMPSASACPCNHRRAARQSSSPAGNGCSGAKRYSTLAANTPASSANRVHTSWPCSGAPRTRPPPWIHSSAPLGRSRPGASYTSTLTPSAVVRASTGGAEIALEPRSPSRRTRRSDRSLRTDGIA